MRREPNSAEAPTSNETAQVVRRDGVLTQGLTIQFECFIPKRLSSKLEMEWNLTKVRSPAPLTRVYVFALKPKRATRLATPLLNMPRSTLLHFVVARSDIAHWIMCDV